MNIRHIFLLCVVCFVLLFHSPLLKRDNVIEQHFDNTPYVSEKDIKCLTDNIYYEARNQPLEGKVAVAFVTLNRVASRKFASDVCGVVYERKVAHICQFSWVCKKPKGIETQAYQEAKHIARYVAKGYNKHISDPTYGALFFHAVYVKPAWRKHFAKTVQISEHIFYGIK